MAISVTGFVYKNQLSGSGRFVHILKFTTCEKFNINIHINQ